MNEKERERGCVRKMAFRTNCRVALTHHGDFFELVSYVGFYLLGVPEILYSINYLIVTIVG